MYSNPYILGFVYHVHPHLPGIPSLRVENSPNSRGRRRQFMQRKLHGKLMRKEAKRDLDSAGGKVHDTRARKWTLLLVMGLFHRYKMGYHNLGCW